MGTAPLISVLIRSSGRGAGLQESLIALGNQTLGRDRFEVLVVEEGSGGEAQRRVESFAAVLNLRFVGRDCLQSRAVWNTALSLARACIVVFVDDDEVLDRRCLEEINLAHNRSPEQSVAVLGCTRLRGDARRSPLMNYLVDAARGDTGDARSCEPEEIDGPVLPCSVPSFKRRFLLAHECLVPDTRLGRLETRLDVRLRKSGLQVVYRPEALSEMIRVIGFEEVCRRCYSRGTTKGTSGEVHREQHVRPRTDTDEETAEWQAIAPLFTRIMKSARELDKFANERRLADLTLDDLTTRLLYRAYSAAFRASHVLGMVDAGSRVPRNVERRDYLADPETAS